jgi:hypothetical protein
MSSESKLQGEKFGLARVSSRWSGAARKFASSSRT